MKKIAILGSTGSIGTQALDVIRQYPDLLCAEVLTAQGNSSLLIEQAIEFHPNVVVIGNKNLYARVFDALDPLGIKVYAGEDAISQVVEMDTIDMVLIAIVGFSGLKPTLSAIKAGKDIALANKETLVVAGEIITGAALAMGVQIIPVDSEHSAIFQCLTGEGQNPVEKIYLTASGGPFRGKSLDYLSKVKKEEALKHPNWNMGCKITIDSATMMNKGLEVIEARWLFRLKPEQIEVVVHPQSIVHSLVQFEDGSLKAQMGLPDMRLPIQYALTWPYRIKSSLTRFDFLNYPELSFEMPDTEKFRNLALAYEAMGKGGNQPCILNAANEVVVSAFLRDKIGFLEMPGVIANCMHTLPFIGKPTIEDYISTDEETRRVALSFII